MLRETTANDWLGELAAEGPGPPRRPWRALALGIALGAVFTLALTALAGGPSLDLAALRSEQAVQLRQWPERELPREWRWQRKAVTFDHMFRQPR